MVGGLTVETFTYTHNLGHARLWFASEFQLSLLQPMTPSIVLQNSLTILAAYTKHINTPREAKVANRASVNGRARSYPVMGQ